MFWNYLKFLRGSKASHVGTATCTWLCALHDPSKPWCGRALRTGTERSARRTPVSSWRIVRLAQRVPALEEWLRCCSYANLKTFAKKLSAAWVFALVPDYAPRSWCVKCMCIHRECKCIRASQNDSKKKNSIADINHTCIPHRNRLLTDVRFSNSWIYPCMAIPAANPAQVLFEH